MSPPIVVAPPGAETGGRTGAWPPMVPKFTLEI